MSGQTLLRRRLIDSCVHQQGTYQFICIEAQAGQGKTTTAIQIIEATQSPYMWFQIGDEDGDPIIFLASILAGIQKTFPEFSSSIAESQLANGQAMIPELITVLNTILRDLDEWLDGELTLVFDDVHLLEQAPHALLLLDHLLETVPPALSVMILSRRPVAFKSKRLRFGGSTLSLTNDDLALTRDEGVDLLAFFLDEAVDAPERLEMVEQSAGWPMGLVLTAQNYVRGGGVSGQDSLATESYFEDELLASLTGPEQEMILKLGLLDEISLDMAEMVCPDVQVQDFLRDLTRANFFLRLLDDQGTVLGFHHHFLAFLRKRGSHDLSGDERTRIWNIVARAYVQKGMVGRGMAFYLKAMNIKALEEIFHEYGHGMVARNRHITLNSILSAVPEVVLAQSGLLSYFFGIILQIPDPDRALRFLRQSRQIYADRQDIPGELLAASGILYLYIIHSQRLPRVQAVFPQEVDQLFEQAGDSLPEYSQISIANHLALGFLFFINDFKKAKFYNDLAASCAVKKGLVNLQIESRIASGWISILSGDYKSGLHVVEQNYPLICQKEVGLSCRTQLYMLQLDYLHHQSEYANFEHQKNEYFARVGFDVLKQSFVYPFLVLWEIELLFSQGKLDKALHLIDGHIHTDKFSVLGNYRGEMLGWRVLCLVCLQNGADVKRDVTEISAWIESGASPLHTVKGMLLLGTMYRISGQMELAQTCLTQGVVVAKQCGLEKMWACALLHRARVFYDAGDEASGQDDLRVGLGVLNEKIGFQHVFACPPEMMLDLLQRGIREDIQPIFCRQYGMERLQLAITGTETIPLLDIQVLGGFQVALPGSAEIGTATTFIKGQRRLLGLLLQSEIHEVGQSVVQASLWPDVPEDKARGRFDTLMARLRKVLKPIVHPHGVKKYLMVRKGVVALRHCQVDRHRFCHLVRRGLVHLQNGEFWQAGNCFYPALHLWKGAVALDLLDLGEGGDFATEPAHYLLEMALSWCPVLSGIHRHDEALRVCALAWQFNHDNGQVARLLYGLYVQSGFTTKARQTLDEFDSALSDQGVVEETRLRLRAEIEDVFP